MVYFNASGGQIQPQQPGDYPFTQFYEAYEAFERDPSSHNLEALMSALEKLENNPSVPKRDQDILRNIEKLLKGYEELTDKIQQIEEELKNPNLTKEERDSLEMQLSMDQSSQELMLRVGLPGLVQSIL